MTINEYQNKALRTANGGITAVPGSINGGLGLCGESGECADLVKKHIFQGHDLDRNHLAKELGDVAWYLAVTAHLIGYDLESIFEMNITKLMERYPEGFDSNRSLHRQTGDI